MSLPENGLHTMDGEHCKSKPFNHFAKVTSRVWLLIMSGT